MKNEWHSHNRRKYLLQYHLILVTKYRVKILDEKLSTAVKQFSYEICRDNNIMIRCMETDKDHIHYMLEIPATMAVSKAVNLIKGYTTWKIWAQYQGLMKKIYWHEHTLWTDGYFISTIGNVSDAKLMQYIKDQG